MPHVLRRAGRPALSPKILMIVGTLLSWVLAAVVELRASKLRHSGAMPDLATLALIAQGFGFALTSQRGLISDWLSVYLANLLIVGAIPAFYLAIEKLNGEHGSVLVAILPPATIALLYPMVGLGEAALVERVVVHAIAMFAAYSMVMVAGLRALGPGRRLGPLLVVASMVSILAAQLIRAFTMIDQSRGDLFAPQAPQIAYNLVVNIALVLAIAGYVLMQSRTAQAPGPAPGAAAGAGGD